MDQKKQRGAALVEFAIIAPVLFIILCGILEYGRVMYMTNSLTNAAREGARRAAVSEVPISIDDAVRSSIPFDPSDVTVSTSPTSPAKGSGAPVTVTVTMPFQALTGVLPDRCLPQTLIGEATMRYEL